MNFYTTSTFRKTLEALIEKPKEGYGSVVKDIVDELSVMSDNVLRDTNDRVLQYKDFRLVKLRLPNSGQHQSKSAGFRLIYWVSLKSNDVVLLRIYPKRGPKGINDLVDAEYNRLLLEMMEESKANSLHQVDVLNNLAEISLTGSL